MISEVLQEEITVALGEPGGACPLSPRVVGIETVTKESWRVWFHYNSWPGALLFLLNLRSNSAGRSFDIQAALNIACCRACSRSPAHVYDDVLHLVYQFDQQRGLADRNRQWRYREIEVAALALPFSDPWDRLWVASAGTTGGHAPPPGAPLLIWQHGTTLYLAVGWHRAISMVLI